MATDGIYERLSEVELPLEVCQPVKHEASHESARATWPDDSRHTSHGGHGTHNGHTAHGSHGAGSAGAGRDTGSFLRSDFLRHDRDWDPPLVRRASPAPEF